MSKIELLKSDVEIVAKGKDFVRINYKKTGLKVNMPKKEFEKMYVLIDSKKATKEPKESK